MENAVVVRRRQASQALLTDVENLLCCEWLTHPRSQCLSIHILHDDHHPAIMFNDVVDTGNALIGELGSTLSLLDQPLTRIPVVAMLAPDGPHCHLPLNHAAPGKKDPPNAAATRLSEPDN